MSRKVSIFYAMEYINLIGNRILKVWVTPEYIFAGKVKGMTSARTNVEEIDSSDWVVDERVRESPYSYINPQLERKFNEIDFANLSPEEFMGIDPEGFVITRARIRDYYQNLKPKWGMGDYPYSGRIIVRSKSEFSNRKRKREFILIGIQDPDEILDYIGNNNETNCD